MNIMTGRHAPIKGDAEEDFLRAVEGFARSLLARDIPPGTALEIAVTDTRYRATGMVRDLCAQHSSEYLASFTPFPED
jgi:hypothetical protein